MDQDRGALLNPRPESQKALRCNCKPVNYSKAKGWIPVSVLQSSSLNGIGMGLLGCLAKIDISKMNKRSNRNIKHNIPYLIHLV